MLLPNHGQSGWSSHSVGSVVVVSPLLPDNVVYPIRYDPLSRGRYSRWEGVLRRMEGLALSHSSGGEEGLAL